MEPNKIIIFEDRKIRRIWHNDEWYYSIVDIVGALTDSINPRDYWYKTKIRIGDEEKAELSTICLQLKLEAPAGKARVDAEKEIGKPIVSKENYLIEPEKQRKLKKGGQNARLGT